MPLPKPRKDEEQDAFISRCMAEAYGDDAPKDRTQDQAVAMCHSQWRTVHGGKPPGEKELAEIIAHWRQLLKQDDEDDSDECPEPEEDESHVDYMDRCGEDHDEDDCQLAWEDYQESKRARGPQIVQKTHAADVHGMEFCLSDETVDRMGDVIMAAGWNLENFKRNPVALFNHRSDFPVGRWRNLAVRDGKLTGRLDMAPKGTSPRIDEIRALIDHGILKAVSVGFKSLEEEPLDKRSPSSGGPFPGLGGKRYLKQELVETSIVSVPANPNALAVAKSLNISADTMKTVFEPSSAKNGNGVTRRASAGEIATIPLKRKEKAMSLSQRISDSQDRIAGMRDKLTDHLKTVDDSNVSDAQVTVTTELNEKIAQAEKGLAALVEAEQRLAATVKKEDEGHVIRMPTRIVPAPGARPFTIPTKKLEPYDYMWRSLTCIMKHHSTKGARTMRDVLVETYGEDEGTAAILGAITRSPAATAPATTTQAGWAAELVAVVMGEFYKALIPKSVFPRLSAQGSSFSFGVAGIITLPMRSTTPTVSGSFVGEGAPIPVRQGQFVTQQLTPKKMAVITTFTREIADHSTPAIEGILRDAVLDDTSIAIDTVLLDTNPATAIRPAGLLNGVAPTTATAGGGFAAVIGDVKSLTNALITATRGNFRNPVWIMSPALAVSLSLTSTTGAQALPFREEVAAGRLMGIPIITSTTVPMGTLILVDAADFASVTGDDPRFEVSDQAVLHMEDTTPLQIGTGGSPATVAAPTRSLWQTDTIGLRMIMPMNWVMRRPTSVVFTQAVTWQ